MHSKILQTDPIETGLQQAVIENSTQKLDSILRAFELLQQGGIFTGTYLMCRDENHRTLIHLAVEHGSDAVLQRLLQIKALSLFAHDDNDDTPLTLAIKKNRPHITQRLLLAGAGLFAEINSNIGLNINSSNFILIEFKWNNVKATPQTIQFCNAITTIDQLKERLSYPNHGIDIARLLMTCDELRLRAVDDKTKQSIADIVDVLTNATKVQENHRGNVLSPSL